MLKNKWFNVSGAFASLVLYFLVFGSVATASPFYQGKTLTVLQGRSPGGTGDLRTRAVIKYLKKHLAGNPTIVSKYRPGGGGTGAANHLANSVKGNGFTIANIGVGIYSSAILGGRGVRFKLDDFVSFGSAYAGGPRTLLIRGDLGLDSVEKLKSYRGLRFANRAVGHSTYIFDRMFAFVLDLQEPKWILGYSSPEIAPAIERGEADAQVQSIHTLLRRTPHWLKKGFSFPVIVKNLKGKGVESIPNFPQDTPTLDQYADTELKQGVMRFYFSSNPGTSAFLAPRGIPNGALKALNEAFDKIWKDPLFPGDYKRMTGEPADPVTGNEMDRSLQQVPKDPKVMKAYKRLIGGGPLPPSK